MLDAQIGENTLLVIVVGGDGMILCGFKFVYLYGVFVFGVNFGWFAFFVEV